MATKASHIAAAEAALVRADSELANAGTIGHRPHLVTEFAAVAQAHAAVAAVLDA